MVRDFVDNPSAQLAFVSVNKYYSNWDSYVGFDFSTCNITIKVEIKQSKKRKKQMLNVDLYI